MALNNIVSNQIALGGGSVVVSSVGALTLTPASGQDVKIVRGSADGADWLTLERTGIRTWAFDPSSGYFNIKDVTGGVIAMSLVYGASGAVSFPGTGTHTFSGPVKVSGAATTITQSFQANTTTATNFTFLTAYNNGTKKFSLNLDAASTDDAIFYSGAAGATESYRITNTGAYHVVATRQGIGVTPSYPLHVSGNMYVQNGVAGFNTAPTPGTIVYAVAQVAGNIAAKFENTAASATQPVMIIKLGATPGAGGDAQQWQNSGSTPLSAIDSSGRLVIQGSGANALASATIYTTDVAGIGAVIRGVAAQTADLFQTQTSAGALLLLVTANGLLDFHDYGTVAPAAPGAGRAKLWYDGTAQAFKFTNAAGVTKTITAA